MALNCRECGQPMAVVATHDEGSGGQYAYNLHYCDCGVICKQDVWDNKGELWIQQNDMINTTKPGGGFNSIKPTSGS
jgi:hypothetical protein